MSLKQVYHSHKRTLWMEEPISNSQSGRRNQGRLKRQIPFKMKSIKRMLIAWEWGINEYIYLTLLWSCGVISSGNQKTEEKWISYFGLGRVIKTPSFGYPTPKWWQPMWGMKVISLNKSIFLKNLWEYIGGIFVYSKSSAM